MVSILVVEDDPIKSRHVQDALKRVEGLENAEIKEANTATKAKRFLARSQFDLAVIDVALPLVEGGEIVSDAGVQLLEEVLAHPDRYRTPMHFIGLTGYEEIFDKYAGRFASSLWTLALYRPGRTEWEQSLQSRARHLVNALKATGGSSEGVDWCIMTALHAPELTSVLALPFDWQQDPRSEDDTLYWRGTMKTSERKHSLVACCCPRMGMPAAAAIASKMIAIYNPKFMAVCGIMAGVKNRTKMGDVVVSSMCWDWGNGKWAIDSATGERKFLLAPHQVHIQPAAREIIKVAAADPVLLAQPWAEWPGTKPPAPPRLRMGVTASGAAVLADKKTIDGLVEQHRELLGIEMELYGILVAAEEAQKPRPQVLSLKAVVDYADGEKADDYQEFGAFMSAAAMKLLIPRMR